MRALFNIDIVIRCLYGAPNNRWIESKDTFNLIKGTRQVMLPFTYYKIRNINDLLNVVK